MTKTYSDRQATRFASFLEKVKDDLQAEGGGAYMSSFLAAFGLIDRENPEDVLPPINPTLQGKLAVIPCFHGEAPQFPEMLDLLLDADAGVLGQRFPPINLTNVQFRYRAAGGLIQEYKHLKEKGFDSDPYNSDCYAVLEQLKPKFSDEVIVDLGFMDCRPFIEEKVIEAVNNGASKVIIVHTMVTVSDHTQEIEDRVEGLKLNEKGVKIVFTEPFWNDQEFINHKIQKLLEIVGDEDRSKVGVANIGYGLFNISPGKLNWGYAETTMRYAQTYMEELKKHGISNTIYGNLRFAKPGLVDSAKALAEKGATLIIFDWFHVARNLHSILDIPRAIQELKSDLPETVRVVMVGPEKDSPGFIDVLIKQVEKAQKALEN